VWRSYAQASDTPGLIEDEQVIQKLRDVFLPRHLARFFFFDAERSQSINLGQQDIVEGVSRILGLWTYGELETDLRQLVQQKIPRVFNSTSGPDPATKLADLSADVLRAEGHLKARRKERDSLERDFNEIEVELLEVEDDLRTLGAVDPEELERAQERRNELTKIKADLEAKLTGVWELEIPVSLLGKYRKELYDCLISEERRREWESAKSTVEPKIPQVKEDIFGSVPPAFALQPDIEAFYIKRLEDALHRLFHHPPMECPTGFSLAIVVTRAHRFARASAQPLVRCVTWPRCASALNGWTPNCVNWIKSLSRSSRTPPPSSVAQNCIRSVANSFTGENKSRSASLKSMWRLRGSMSGLAS
jgi:hypothetical protein